MVLRFAVMVILCDSRALASPRHTGLRPRGSRTSHVASKHWDVTSTLPKSISHVLPNSPLSPLELTSTVHSLLLGSLHPEMSGYPKDSNRLERSSEPLMISFNSSITIRPGSHGSSHFTRTLSCRDWISPPMSHSCLCAC